MAQTLNHQLVINLSSNQLNDINALIKEQGEVNIKEETFSGYSFTLSCTEFGMSFLEIKMNKTIDLGEVEWEII